MREAHSIQHTARHRRTVVLGLRASFVCLLIAVCCLLVSRLTWACPFCSEALFSPGQAAAQQGVWKGYLVSIAVLICIPLVLVGTIALVIVRAMRRSRRLASRSVNS